MVDPLLSQLQKETLKLHSQVTAKPVKGEKKTGLNEVQSACELYDTDVQTAAGGDAVKDSATPSCVKHAAGTFCIFE